MISGVRSKPTADTSACWTVAFAVLLSVAAILAVAGLATAASPALADEQGVASGTALSDNGTVESDAFGPTVYVGSENGTVYAIDVDSNTPEKLWAFAAGDEIRSAPTVSNGTVYVGAYVDGQYDERLYALDAETGDVEWEFTDIYTARSSPTIVNGTVYFADGDLHAIDAETGTEQWSTPLSKWSEGAPHVVGDTAYVSDVSSGNGDANVVAVDVATGDIEWEYEIPNNGGAQYGDGSLSADGVKGSPTWHNGTVYVGPRLGQGGIHAIDAETGQQEWEMENADPIVSSAVIADDTVYFPTRYNGITMHAVDAETGQEEWYFTDDDDGGSYVQGSATVVDGTVYFGSIGNNASDWGGNRENSSLYAIDADTGDLEWKFDEPEQRIDTTPTVHDGIVYFGGGKKNKYDPDGNGTLYAVDADTGNELFTYENPVPASGFASSPTVVEDADGDSIGSRVTQGILGHTDSFPNPTGIEGTLTDATGDPIQGGTITVRGESKTAVTDGSGQYTLWLDPGEYTLDLSAPGFEAATVSVDVADGELVGQDGTLAPAHAVGDVDRDGEVSIVDAVLIQQHLAEMDPDPFDPALADVQRTGEVSIVDAVLIQQYLAELRDAGSAEITGVSATTADDGTTTVTATVENTGGMGTLQTAEHRLADDEDSLGEDATRALGAIDLEPAGEETLTFTVDTAALDPGTYYYEVVTDDDSQTLTIQVGSDSSTSISAP